MRSIFVSELISDDGVVEAPGGEGIQLRVFRTSR
jgi:hypothetical protein